MLINVHQTRLAEGLPLPARAHETDIGFDIPTAVDFSVAPGESVKVPTGLVFDLPEEPLMVGGVAYRVALIIEQRTGNGGKGLIPGATVVDPGYRSDREDVNGLTLLLRNVNRPYRWRRSKGVLAFKRGDRVVQGLFMLFPVLSLSLAGAGEIRWDTERGGKRFGATGR